MVMRNSAGNAPTICQKPYEFSGPTDERHADGGVPLSDWLDTLRDARARARIVARLDRLRVGLLGDWKSAGNGVVELRIDYGPGYRVYCGQDGESLILLLCGGDKRTQARDIEKAHGYWKDYKARKSPFSSSGPSKRPG
jgi:putative addiction module killer protein